MKHQRWKDFCYAMGNFSGGIVGYAMGLWFMYFYVDQLGLSPGYYSLAMVIYGIWNAINDPVMGIISDKTKSRWGRRKPFMLFGAVPFGLALIILFSPPQFFMETQRGLFIYFTASLCVYDTFFTMTMLAWSAALPEMYLDEKNRARVGAISQAMGVVGAMIATVGAEYLIDNFGYSMMAIVFAVIGILTMIMGAFGVREREVNIQGGSLPLWQSFKATFTNKAFVICVLSVLLVEIGKSIFTSTLAFYSDYVLQQAMGTTIIMGIVFGTSIGFAFVVSWLCSKIGSKNTYIIGVAVFALSAMGYMFAPSIIMAGAVSVAAGFGLAGVLVIPNVLYAQIIDDDQVRTGVRRDGTFFGMNALVMRLGIVVQGLVSGFVLNISGYVSGAETQTVGAIWGIRSLMGLIPLIFAVIAIIVLFFYPIDKERLAVVQERVRIMNEEDGGEKA